MWRGGEAVEAQRLDSGQDPEYAEVDSCERVEKEAARSVGRRSGEGSSVAKGSGGWPLLFAWGESRQGLGTTARQAGRGESAGRVSLWFAVLLFCWFAVCSFITTYIPL